MKLTDIDLSSLAEVGKAITLLEHVHRGLADRHRERNEPLPTIIPGFVVNPDAARQAEVHRKAGAMLEAEMQRSFFAEHPPAQAFVVNPTPTAGGHTHWQDADAMERFVSAEAEKLPSAIEMMRAASAQEAAAIVGQMDAATVFGQSAAPLPQSAPASAGVAASPTAPAAPPASGALPALPALAPLPAPSAAALVASVVQPSHAGGVDLDTDGLPWDGRIHAGTKRKNADGRWTAKKGINDPDLVAQVRAQLRAQMVAGGLISGNINAQPVATAPAPHVKAEPVDALKTLATLPPATPAPTAGQFTADRIAAQQQEALRQSAPATAGAAASPTVHVAPRASGPTSPASAPTPTTFQDFMTALTVEVQAGRVPIEALGAACQPLGGVSALNAKPELIPVAWTSLKAKYPGML